MAVLLDINLPDGSGLDLLRRFKQQKNGDTHYYGDGRSDRRKYGSSPAWRSR